MFFSFLFFNLVTFLLKKFQDPDLWRFCKMIPAKIVLKSTTSKTLNDRWAICYVPSFTQLHSTFLRLHECLQFFMAFKLHIFVMKWPFNVLANLLWQKSSLTMYKIVIFKALRISVKGSAKSAFAQHWVCHCMHWSQSNIERYKFHLFIHLLKLYWSGQKASQITTTSNRHWSQKQPVPGGPSQCKESSSSSTDGQQARHPSSSWRR